MSDQERLKTLDEYQILDSVPEREFDDIVELASAFFHTPISIISILDSHRQWFKAKVGLDAPETPIEHAFCYHAIQKPNEVMVINDSFLDIRFQNNPLAIGSPHVRFYAGAPIVTNDGIPLGTLCVIDNQPRNFSAEQERVLKILAEKVIQRLDIRKENLHVRRLIAENNKKLEFTLKRLLEAERLAEIGNWTFDVSTSETYWSPEVYRLFDKDANDEIPLSISVWGETIHPEDRPQFYTMFSHAIKNVGSFSMEFRNIRKNGTHLWLRLQGITETDEAGHMQMKGTVMNITEIKVAEKNKEQYTQTLEETLFALSHKIRRPVANILGIINELGRSEQTENEYVPYLKTAADELDTYIHELNDFIHSKKINMRKGDVL